MDANFDGSVTREELSNLLKNLSEYISDQQIDDMIHKADLNHDGTI